MWGNWPKGRKTNLVHTMDQKPGYLLSRTIFSIFKPRWKEGLWKLFPQLFSDPIWWPPGTGHVSIQAPDSPLEFRDTPPPPISYYSGLSERFTQFLQSFSLPLWMTLNEWLYECLYEWLKMCIGRHELPSRSIQGHWHSPCRHPGIRSHHDAPIKLYCHDGCLRRHRINVRAGRALTRSR